MARIKVEFTGGDAGNFRARRLMRKAIRAVYEPVNYMHDAAVDVLLTDDAGIREINCEHRGVDKPTDVLSFPMTDMKEGRELNNWHEYADPQTDAVFLGDIVVSLDRAAVQAREYGHSFERECAYLTVHSMLHLMGFDHETEADKRLMRRHEEDIMARLGLGRNE